ncbi:hypothetical protein FP2506_15939 [Fulvimarina pelagi HTCC2506]|uniref:Uncharacterized protein n=1 Tax=Fulvimarina pelagi HTCC2506 TaxID=314231 RepID=Q0G392_9HYPH|nr:hypothetical protein FP2506_15939 [Fulvimarina pelagi HTCC2506]
MAQMLEGFQQVPVIKRFRLFQRIRLGLDQRQVVHRIHHEGPITVALAVPGDLRGGFGYLNSGIR